MVDSDGVPEQIRSVLDGVLRDLRVDRPDRAALYRDVTERIGRDHREHLDAEWWEALCVGFAFPPWDPQQVTAGMDLCSSARSATTALRPSS